MDLIYQNFDVIVCIFAMRIYKGPKGSKSYCYQVIYQK